MRTRALLSLIAFGALAGCGAGRNAPITTDRAQVADWRRIATPADRTRLRGWRTTWVAALAEAQRADAAALAREGVLFVPDRALADAVPPAGRYRCRTFKLGGRNGGGRGFTVYPAFACRVAVGAGVVSFSKDGGSQRPSGVIFDGDGNRAVFLGTLLLGDEANALRYGRDPNRDLAGVVERIDARRWRLVLPEPRFESRLDVIELVPAD